MPRSTDAPRRQDRRTIRPLCASTPLADKRGGRPQAPPPRTGASARAFAPTVADTSRQCTPRCGRCSLAVAVMPSARRRVISMPLALSLVVIVQASRDHRDKSAFHARSERTHEAGESLPSRAVGSKGVFALSADLRDVGLDEKLAYRSHGSSAAHRPFTAPHARGQSDDRTLPTHVSVSEWEEVFDRFVHVLVIARYGHDETPPGSALAALIIEVAGRRRQIRGLLPDQSP